MSDLQRRTVTLGKTQAPPLSVPGEIFTVYQPAIGHVATLLWLNMRWAAHVGAPFTVEDMSARGITASEKEIERALHWLKAYELLDENAGGDWVLNDPLPEAVYRMRCDEFQQKSEQVHELRPLSTAVGESASRDDAPQTALPLLAMEARPDPPRRPSAETPAPDDERTVERTKEDAAAQRVMRSPLSKKRAQSRMLKLVDEHTDDSQPVNEDMQAVFQIYHKRIGMLGPTQYEKLRFWIEEQGMEGAVVALAIEETVCSAETPRISYLEGILRNWYNDGIRTLADVGEKSRASKVFKGADGTDARVLNEGRANASAYQSVSAEMVAKWKELYPDEYDR